MFNKFFNKKDQSKGARKPPAPVVPGRPDPPPVPDGMSGGGGFFNLPPPVPQQPSPASGAPPAGKRNSAPTVQGTSSAAGDLFGGMSVHGGARRGTTGSTAPGHNLRPGSAHSSPGQSPANAGSEGRGHAAPESRSYNPSPSSGIHSGTDFTGVGQGYVENKVASAGSGDLFGGMSVKAAPPSSSGGSLFSGLGVSAGTSASILSPSVTTSAGASPDNASLMDKSPSVNSATTNNGGVSHDHGATSANRAVKAPNATRRKKRQTFRPGFGRQLSPESAARLQDGSLETNESGAGSLPVGHDADDSSTGRISSQGGLLAGLTLRGQLDQDQTRISSEGYSERRSSQSSMRSSDASSVDSPATFLQGLGEGSSGPAMPATMDPHLASLISDLSVDQKRASLDSPVDEMPQPDMTNASPEERLGHVLRAFQFSASSYRSKLEKLALEEAQIGERRQRLEQQVAAAKSELEEKEKQQEIAVEQEDFEAAEALNSTMRMIEHGARVASTELRSAEEQAAEIERRKTKAFTAQLEQTRKSVEELERFRNEWIRTLNEVEEDERQWRINEERRLAVEEERIQLMMRHVDLDRKHLQEEEQATENAIKEQCLSDFEERDRLLEEKGSIDAEVQRLEAELAVKKKEQEEYASRVSAVEEKIDVVRRKFSRQLKRLESRAEGLRKAEEESQAEVALIEKGRAEMKKRAEDVKRDTAEYKRRIKMTGKELRSATLLHKTMRSREERRQKSLTEAEGARRKLKELKEVVLQSGQALTTATREQQLLVDTIAQRRKDGELNETKLPQLDEDKRAAAAAKNYKEAARINKEIKRIKELMEREKEEITTAQTKVGELEALVKKKEQEKERAEKELGDGERELDLIRLHRLWDDEKELRRALRKIQGRRESSDSASGADGTDFQAAALALLQVDLESTTKVVEELQRKHADVERPAEEGESDESEGSGDDDVGDELGDHEDDENDVDEGGKLPQSQEDDEDGAAEMEPTTRPTVDDTLGATKAHDEDDAPAVVSGDMDEDLECDLSDDDIEKAIREIEGQIEEAVEKEDYDRAASLDEKLVFYQRVQDARGSKATPKNKAIQDSPTDPVPEVAHDQEEEDGENTDKRGVANSSRTDEDIADSDHSDGDDSSEGTELTTKEDAVSLRPHSPLIKGASPPSADSSPGDVGSGILFGGLNLGGASTAAAGPGEDGVDGHAKAVGHELDDQLYDVERGGSNDQAPEGGNGMRDIDAGGVHASEETEDNALGLESRRLESEESVAKEEAQSDIAFAQGPDAASYADSSVKEGDQRFSIDSEDEEELEATSLESDELDDKEAPKLALGQGSSDRTSLVNEDDSHLKYSGDLGKDLVAGGETHARSGLEHEARRNCTDLDDDNDSPEMEALGSNAQDYDQEKAEEHKESAENTSVPAPANLFAGMNLKLS